MKIVVLFTGVLKTDSDVINADHRDLLIHYTFACLFFLSFCFSLYCVSLCCLSRLLVSR